MNDILNCIVPLRAENVEAYKELYSLQAALGGVQKLQYEATIWAPIRGDEDKWREAMAEKFPLLEDPSLLVREDDWKYRPFRYRSDPSIRSALVYEILPTLITCFNETADPSPKLDALRKNLMNITLDKFHSWHAKHLNTCVNTTEKSRIR